MKMTSQGGRHPWGVVLSCAPLFSPDARKYIGAFYVCQLLHPQITLYLVKWTPKYKELLIDRGVPVGIGFIKEGRYANISVYVLRRPIFSMGFQAKSPEVLLP